VVVSGQTQRLAPADGKLYALRDVTGTVPSLPLIASSIMSKKIAAGADAIVLDVKVGRGAFMKTLDEAEALAQVMVDIGIGVGRRVSAVISDMNQPLGRAVGNALELAEALDTLRGRGPADYLEHCLVVAEQMLVLGGRTPDLKSARSMLVEALEDGRALDKATQWIVAQGGAPSVMEDPPPLPAASIVRPLLAPRSGVVSAIDAKAVGLAAVELGAGRAVKGASIDHAVGIVLRAKVGDEVRAGDVLLTIHAGDEARYAVVHNRLLAAYSWAEGTVSAPPLVYKVIE
jgi:pyrimidine-nucleoside phosphorylase